jgi:adenylate cyclase
MDTGVSREHASLLRREGAWWVQDLGSSNGTFVNGLPATAPMRLREGDEVRFGPAAFRFHDGEPGRTTMNDTSDRTIVAQAPRSATVTLLVADIMGYSSLSTKFTPEEIGSAMSAWCADCRKLIHAAKGHIDKFIGDCVFAWWHGDSAEIKAAALAAARQLAAGHESHRLPDGSALRCGIALHSGTAALSQLGPGTFTLLGADVNLAFRLESLTRRLSELLVSRAFADGWPEGQFRSLGSHEIKGWDAPVEVMAESAGRGTS